MMAGMTVNTPHPIHQAKLFLAGFTRARLALYSWTRANQQRHPTHAIKALATVLTCSLPIAVWAGNGCDTQASLTNPQVATRQAPGIGGTGMVAARPGIGGTGMLAARPGIGGTGIDQGGLGGTGIVGVITGFASICVGGVEVHYNDDTPMSENGQPSRASALAVGQMVVVNAAGVGDQVQARQVTLLHVAIGPLQSVNAQTGQFSLLGQHAVAATPAQLAGLQSAQWVRVSGQRNATGDIVASHIEAVPPQAQAQLLGVLSQPQQGSVVGTPVDLSADQAANLAPNTEVLALGLWTGDRLVVTHLTPEPTQHALGQPERVVLEGFVRQVQGERLELDHRVMTLSAQTQVNGSTGTADAGTLRPNQQVRVIGRMDAQQHIQVERVESIHRGGSNSAHAVSKPATNDDVRAEKDNFSASDISQAHENKATDAHQNASDNNQSDSHSSDSRDAGSSSSGNSGHSGHSGSSSHSGDSKGGGSSGKSGDGHSKGK